MSTPAFQHNLQVDWMQHHHPYQLFGAHATVQPNHQYGQATSDAPYGYEQTQAFHPQYQQYDVAEYAAHPVIHPTHSPKPDIRHRRQNSTSTNGSYNSFRSPHPNATQVPYSAGFDNSYIDPSHDAYYANTQFQKHLPTPSRTPTQEAYMDGQRGYDRRSGGGMTGQKYPRDDGPNTPRTINGDQEEYNGHAQGHKRVPTFDRTYSAIVQDELYDPNALRQPQQSIHSTQPNKHLAAPPSQYRNMVTDRLQAANEARSGRAPIGRVSREVSPFRQNSPYAGSGPTFAPIGSAAGQRQLQKAESDAIAYQRHHQLPDESQPKTISPKDAVLDYHEQPDEGGAGPPLFPQNSSASDGSNYDGTNRQYGAPMGRQHMHPQYQPPASTFSFAAPSMPASAHPMTTMDYKFAPQHYKTEASEDSQEQQDYPAHLISMDTSKSEQEDDSQSHENDIERPASTTADGGTYTCTYHGCTQRFATPALLQKHKREGHRASVSDPSQQQQQQQHHHHQQQQQQQQQQPASPGGSTTPRNSQAGPHRCDRINPSTGKPCNTVFSRPYDLTRHEDTIHAQRTKVRCQYCTEEKTFSRNDALTRHMRVVHPNIDFPGKHRRRPTEL